MITTVCRSRAVAFIFSHTLERAPSLGSFSKSRHRCDHCATCPVWPTQKSSAVTFQCLLTRLSLHDVPRIVGVTEKRQLQVSNDVNTCCVKPKASCSHAIISKGICPTIPRRMASTFNRGCYSWFSVVRVPRISAHSKHIQTLPRTQFAENQYQGTFRMSGLPEPNHTGPSFGLSELLPSVLSKPPEPNHTEILEIWRFLGI